MFFFLGLPGVLLAAFLAAYAGSILASTQRRERANLRLRGADRRHLRRMLLYRTMAFASAGSDVRLEARTYDADDARIHYAHVYFEQGTGLKKGERTRAYFDWNGDKRAARVVLLDPNEKGP